jgi:hypothetical protein
VRINDLVKEEAQRQIDLAIEEIPCDRSRLSTAILVVLLGFEYGHITGMCACYYQNQVEQSGRGVMKEEVRQVTNEISSIIVDRLPEIQAILKTG